MKEVRYQILTNQDMSTSFQSASQDLSFYIVYAFQAVYTGSPVGTLTLEASNDNGTTWTTITGSSSVVNGASNTMWNVQNAGYKLVRLAYAATSGTGSLTATYFGKGI